MRTKAFTLLTLSLLFIGCEAPYVGEPQIDAESDANVTLHVTGFEIVPFADGTSASLVKSRSEQPITDLCSRLTFVVYQGDTKYRSVAQKQGDKDFGTAAFSLPQGTYTFAVIGYSGDGACTVSSLDKISFKDNRVTDTFLYSAELPVTDQPSTHDILLSRVVAMVRFMLTDEGFPEDVSQLKFYYTGGSSTLSALSTFGSVNSKQTVKFDIVSSQKQFDLYTFPHSESGSLKMTVTALDASGNTVKERVFEGVPVRCNAITKYTGRFFEDISESSDISFGMKADGAWEEGDDIAF